MNKDLFMFFIALLCSIDSTNYIFLVPIIPDFLQKRGVSLTIIGFILSTYQISNILTYLYLAKNLIYFSKTKVIFIGQALLIINNIGMSFLNEISSNALIIVLTILMRFMQGMALAMISSPIYSYVPILYPDQMEKKFALIEICSGLGLALGPVIAGFLYELTGFSWSFNIMAIVYFLTILITFSYIYRYNKILEEEAKIEQEKSTETLKSLGLIRIFKNPKFLLTFFLLVFCLMSYYVIQPDFSAHIHSYKGNDETVGLIFGLGDFTYAITGLLMMQVILKSNIERKKLFIFGGILALVSLLLLGPETYTYIPKGLISVVIGISILGCSQMFYIPLIIPEILDILNEIDSTAKGNEEMASAFFMSTISATSFIGSILGGFLCDIFGFERAMTIYAMFLLCYLVLYGVLRKSERKIKEEKGDTIIDSEKLISENEEKLSLNEKFTLN